MTSLAPHSRVTRGAALAGLGLMTLAGCAADGDVTEPETVSPDVSTSPTSVAPPSAPTYADGTYTAEGSYVAPSGPETIAVSVTLADDLVTAVEVIGDAVDHSAFEFQRRFAKGIADEVVGRDLADLSVDRVSGASLTGIGFNAALEAIRSEALL